MQIAQSSHATQVIDVLKTAGGSRKPVHVSKINVSGAGCSSVNGEYFATDASEVPKGFNSVCVDQGWHTPSMWQKLNAGAVWYKGQNEAYIYFNQSDLHWWIDGPEGDGVYK